MMLSLDSTLPHGHFRGQRLRDVIATRPDYAIALAEFSWFVLDAEAAAAVHALREQRPAAASAEPAAYGPRTLFASGQYLDRSVAYVAAQDPYYLLWRMATDPSFTLDQAALDMLAESVHPDPVPGARALQPGDARG